MKPTKVLPTMAAIVVLATLSACAGAGGQAPAGSGDEIPGEAVIQEPDEQADTPALPSPGTPLVFLNGLVVTVTGAEPIENGAVVVENGLITAVGPAASITIPEGAAVFDMEGHTILPGLIDGRASALLSKLNLEDGVLNSISADFYLHRFLERGVTTLRATGWTWAEMQSTPTLLTALGELGNDAPTVIIAGASLAHSEGPAVTKYYPNQTVGVGTVEEARQTTDAIIDLGAHQVNFLMSSGPSLDETLEERSPVLTPEMLAAIVETGHARGTRVVGQALFPEEALAAVDAGADEITSWPSLMEPMPDQLIETLVSNSIPILTGFSVGRPQEGDVRRFLDAGGILVFGTFAPNSQATPESEFRLMDLLGMNPMEMIESATINAAQAVGLSDSVGTLEVGKQADILVVEGNLFEGNFASIIGDVTYVVKNGDLVIQPDP